MSSISLKKYFVSPMDWFIVLLELSSLQSQFLLYMKSHWINDFDICLQQADDGCRLSVFSFSNGPKAGLSGQSWRTYLLRNTGRCIWVTAQLSTGPFPFVYLCWNLRDIHSCVTCHERGDVAVPILLRVKPQPMFSNLKALKSALTVDFARGSRVILPVVLSYEQI